MRACLALPAIWLFDCLAVVSALAISLSLSTARLVSAQAAGPLGVLSEQAYLKAHARDALDDFGGAVSVDGNTMVVGAVNEDGSARVVNGAADNAAPEAGAAYVFVRTGSVWVQQAYLKASNADAGDRFGKSVAISGDTIVVGAYNEGSSARSVNGDAASNGAPGAGAAYVFVRQGVTWSQQAFLKAANADTGDLFGWSVAISGDRIVVGAWSEDSRARGVNGDASDNGASQAGAAYVFDRTAGGWTQTAYLKAFNTEALGNDDLFGWDVAVSGDVVLVSAPGEDGSATTVNGADDNRSFQAGAGYVFVPAGEGWRQEAYLKGPNLGSQQRLGQSVAVTGTTAVMASSYGVLVFVRSSGWEQQALLTGLPAGPTGGSAIAGDLLVVGTGSDNGGRGSVHVYERAGGRWQAHSVLTASNPDPLDSFGDAVAIAGETIVVGATGESSLNGAPGNNGGFRTGAAYVFAPGVGPPTGGVPGAPVLTGSVIALTATLNWTPGPGGAPSSYEVQASSDATFTQIFLQTSVGSSTSVSGVVGVGFRAWVRVIARNAVGQATSNVVLLEAGGSCAAPSTPAPQLSKAGSNATISWAAVVGASGYRVEADVNGVMNVFQAVLGNVTSVTGGNLAAATYAVRLFAIGTCGESAPASLTFAMP
jgi:hypothetical protein